MISKLQSDLQMWDQEVHKLRGAMTQSFVQQPSGDTSGNADLRARLVDKDRQLADLKKEFGVWKETCTKQAAIMNAEKAYKDNVCEPFLTEIAEKDKQIQELKASKPSTTTTGADHSQQLM